MIKGNRQHVMPDETGWCVIDEANQMVLHHFDTQEEALEFAHRQAELCESAVLVHATPCDPASLPTVPLPQRHFIPGTGHSACASMDLGLICDGQPPAEDNENNPAETALQGV